MLPNIKSYLLLNVFPYRILLLSLNIFTKPTLNDLVFYHDFYKKLLHSQCAQTLQQIQGERKKTSKIIEKIKLSSHYYLKAAFYDLRAMSISFNSWLEIIFLKK